MATYYWVGGAGTWDNASTANWSASSGGAPGAGPPLATDTAVFNAASAAANYTVTVAATARALNVTLSNPTGGVVILSLAGDAIFSGALSHVSGTLHLQTAALTAQSYSGSNANARTIAAGTGGALKITGSNNVVWLCADTTNLTISGNPYIDFTYSGSVGIRYMSHGETVGAEATAISFRVSAGTDTVYFTDNTRIRDFEFTGFAGTLTARLIYVYGSYTLNSAMTVQASTTQATIFAGTGGPYTITCAGKNLDFPVTFNGVGGTWTFADNFASGTARTLTLTNGTLNANDKNVSIGNFTAGSGTKTLTLGSGTWTVNGTSWNANTNVTNLTVSSSTGIISLISASTKTFQGGGKVWPTINQGGAGALVIQQSNTFANITNTVQPATITLTSGTTQTVTDFDASGTSGNLITLNASTPGSQATLTDSGGANSVSYVDIKDIAATGYGEWQAYTSNGNVDSGNNVGWVFAAPPPLTASEYQISFKSFTERRSF